MPNGCSRPVGRLAGAAQRVGAGDLDVQVVEEEGDDEIAMLGRLFNQMTRQLKGQREALIEGHDRTETQRRLFDSVLSNVTAGVIGLDADGRIDFVNRAAIGGCWTWPRPDRHAMAAIAVPEFAALFQRLRDGIGAAVQDEVRLIAAGQAGKPAGAHERTAQRGGRSKAMWWPLTT